MPIDMPNVSFSKSYMGDLSIAKDKNLKSDGAGPQHSCKTPLD